MQHADATEWFLSDDPSAYVDPATPQQQLEAREAAAEFKRIEGRAAAEFKRMEGRADALYRATVRPRAARRACTGFVVGRRPCVAPRAPRRASARRAVPAARGDDPPPGPPPPRPRRRRPGGAA